MRLILLTLTLPVRAVMSILIDAQFAAEKAAGLGEDDEDDEGPRMRLVKD